MANFWSLCCSAAALVASAIRPPTVTTIPHFWLTSALMFGT
jgi:hypothetical protein